MKRLRRISDMGPAWLALVVLLAGAAAGDPVTISCREVETFAADRPMNVYHLSHRLVVASSDSVFAGGEHLVRDVDYRPDYAEGIIYLYRTPSQEDSIRVRYAYLPPGLKPSYCLRPVGRKLEAETARLDPGGSPIRTARSYDIKASGSKTVSVETGTFKELRVNQSLNLSLGGTIGEEVEIRGVLSDRDVTFDNVGSTTRLRDLDRIFMEVRSPSAYARVGDLEINEAPGELLKFRRNMTGFLGNASLGSGEFAASGAASRSEFETIEIRGREGIAGPYAVTGRDGERADIVKHSDRVWLDGREMARGSEADYTIDYALAEIYINPRHIIRDDARIIVDYESRRNDDRRQFYFARSSLDLGSRSSVAVAYVNEGYSPAASDPLAAGSSPQSILGSGDGDWVDGGRFVGAGKGGYIRVDLDTLSYYEFVGTGLGDYEVTFTRVEAGEGRYSYVLSEAFDDYIYIYTGQGDYTDMVRALPRVESRVLHLKASARPVSWIEIASEAAQSEGHCEQSGGLWKMETDRAYTLGLTAAGRLPEVGGLSLGNVDFEAGRRSIGPHYIGFDRLRRPDFLEFWGQEAPDGFEKSNHAGLAHSLGEKIRTTFEVGSLETGAGDSRRYGAGVDLGGPNLGVSASTRIARTETGDISSGREANGVVVRVPLKGVRLSVGRDYELRSRLRDSTSTRRAEYFSRAALGGGRGNIQLGFSASREEREAGAGWFDYSTVREANLDFEARAGRALALRGGVSQRRIAYSEHAGLGSHRTTGADLHMNLRDISLISSMSLDYRLANTLSAVYESKLVKMESGDYDSLGNYVPDAGGYVLSRSETGKQPVTRVKAGLKLELGRKGKVILDRSVSARTVIDVEGETANGPAGRVAMLESGYLLNSPDAVYGLVDIRQEVVMRRSRALTMSVNVRGSRSLDARCSGRRERKSSLELYGRVLASGLQGTSMRLEGKTSKVASGWQTDSGGASPTRRTWLAKLDLERSIRTGLDGRLKAELSDETRDEPRSKMLETRFGPGITLLKGPLRCDAAVSIRRILRYESDVAAATPKRDSVDWSSRITTRHGRHTSLSVEYSGHRYRGLTAVHNVRASLSASF